MGLSRRAYAAHRLDRGLPGGTDTAVRKAITTGRITLEADGSIDPGKADREWASGTDAAFQRSPEAQMQGVQRARETIEADERRPVPAAAVETVREAVSGGEGAQEAGLSGGITYQKAKAAKEAIMAQLAQIRLKKERKQVVEREPAKLDIYDLSRQYRDHMMQLPARSAAILAAQFEVDAHAMEMALDDLIRDHVALLIEARIEILEPPKQ